MSWAELYAELKGWQSGLGALLGFIALMIAALWNFHLNRRRDDQLRRAESDSVLAALYGETILLREQAAILARVVAGYEMSSREFNEDFVVDYQLREPVVFPALADKLGLLPTEYLFDFSKFYADYEEARRNVAMLTPREGFTYSSLVVLDHAVSAVDDIEEAIQRIELTMGFPAATKPDCGRARDYIAEQREMFDHPPG